MNFTFIVILVLDVVTSDLCGAPLEIHERFPCFKDSEQYWSFGTKSIYPIMEKRQFVKPQGCKASQMIMIARHGTRSPSKWFIENQSNILTELKDKLCYNRAKLCLEDYTKIKSWENDAINDKSNKDLNEQGILDMIGLGKSIKTSFPELTQLYDKSFYDVLTATEDRCKASGLHLINAVLDYEFKDKDIPTYEEDDNRLNLYVLQKEIAGNDENNERSLNEVKLFGNSKSIEKVISNVIDKMGLDELSYEQLRTMYESCRSDKCRYKDVIPAWCRVFSAMDLETLEYADDLYWYNLFGYGNPSHRLLTCPMLEQINLNFKAQSRKDKHTKKGFIYVAHRSNLISAVVMLGLGAPGPGDEPLRHDNFENVRKRKWKTSLFSPFAANVIGTYYRCTGDDDKVAFYLNEQVVKIELDDGEHCEFCSWKKLEEKLDRLVAECNKHASETEKK